MLLSYWYCVQCWASSSYAARRQRHEARDSRTTTTTSTAISLTHIQITATARSRTTRSRMRSNQGNVSTVNTRSSPVKTIMRVTKHVWILSRAKVWWQRSNVNGLARSVIFIYLWSLCLNNESSAVAAPGIDAHACRRHWTAVCVYCNESVKMLKHIYWQETQLSHTERVQHRTSANKTLRSINYYQLHTIWMRKCCIYTPENN